MPTSPAKSRNSINSRKSRKSLNSQATINKNTREKIQKNLEKSNKAPGKPEDPLPIGKEKILTYKPKKKCLCPSDFGFVIFTFIIIFVPAMCCLIVVIWMSDFD